MDIKIKKAKNKDYEDVNRMLTNLHNYHAKNSNVFFEITQYYTKKEYEKRIAKNHRIYIAKVDNKSVGVIEIGIKYSSISISAIYVDEEYRKLGIGKKLIEKVLKYYNKHKKELSGVITLQVFDFNKNAIEFYKNLGFSYERHIMEFNKAQKINNEKIKS